MSSPPKKSLCHVGLKDEAAGLQPINLTASTTGDLVFMGVTKSCPVQWCPQHMEHLTLYLNIF